MAKHPDPSMFIPEHGYSQNLAIIPPPRDAPLNWSPRVEKTRSHAELDLGNHVTLCMDWLPRELRVESAIPLFTRSGDAGC